MRDYLKVQSLFARIAGEDMAARAHTGQVRPHYYSGMLERIAMDATRSRAPRYCDRALIQCLMEQIGAYNDPRTQLVLRGDTAWQPQDPGFRVRRFEDDLIVTQVTWDDRFQVGDVIAKVQNNAIPDYRNQVWRTLRSRVAENEDWLTALQFSATVHLRRKNGLERLPLAGRPLKREAAVNGISFQDGLCLLRLDDLSDGQAVSALLADNAQAMAACRATLVDLRRCGSQGGAWQALMPLLARAGEDMAALAPDEGIYMLYSAGNKALYRAQLTAMLHAAQDPDGRKELEDMLCQLAQKDGWVFEPGEQASPSPLQPLACGKLILLTDGGTGPDGEAFVQAARRLGRAAVVGRNTLGALDYCRPQLRPLDGSIALLYTTAMNPQAYEGRCINGLGLAPDIHVPWSPQCLAKDLDLEAARAL